MIIAQGNFDVKMEKYPAELPLLAGGCLHEDGRQITGLGITMKLRRKHVYKHFRKQTSFFNILELSGANMNLNMFLLLAMYFYVPHCDSACQPYLHSFTGIVSLERLHRMP